MSGGLLKAFSCLIGSMAGHLLSEFDDDTVIDEAVDGGCSGRNSTRELRDFGQVQVLFVAVSEALLLQQIQGVSLGDYQAECVRLTEAEVPRQFFPRLHHDPLKTIQTLFVQHSTRFTELMNDKTLPVQERLVDHTY